MKRQKPRKPALDWLEIPPEFIALIDRRTLRFLESLPLADYDLRALLRSAYTQGLLDAMQLAGERPNTFDAAVLGGEGG